MRTAWTIEHTYGAKHDWQAFGAFSTRRDAERYLADNNEIPNARITQTAANTTCDWGADCPVCKTRAERAWDKGYTGTIELWWRCPKCNMEFTR